MSLVARTPAATYFGPPPRPPVGAERDQPATHRLQAFVDGGFVTGTIRGRQRLSDTLNAAEMLVVREPELVAADGGADEARDAGLLIVETRDAELVLGEELAMTRREREARRIFKVRYPVTVSTRSFEILGIIHVFPGADPEWAAAQRGPRFLALRQAQLWAKGGEPVARSFDVALVNRAFVQAIRQASFGLD